MRFVVVPHCVVRNKVKNYKKVLRMNFFGNYTTQFSTPFFRFKRLIVSELYLKHLLKFSSKCYHKVHETVELNEIFNMDCNNGYRTRSKTAQLVIPKSSKIKLMPMSPKHRGQAF